MAKSRTPDALVRRHLIEKELSVAQALRTAEAYLADVRVMESLIFLKKADALDRLRVIAEQAKLDGDVFLLRQATTLLGEPPTAGDWRETAEAARREGKLRYAADADRQAERQGA